MDWPDKFKITVYLLVAAAAIRGTHGDTMVTGTVFCDQCKDGQVTLFDYPISGVKVAMACPGSNGQVTMLGEETTNWIGNYAMRFDGTPDLSSCYAQVSSSGQGSMGCGAAAGPPQHLRLMFRMFDMGMYTVDPLLSQPPQPMSFCPRSASPVPVHVPAPVTPSRPPPFRLPPMPQLPPMPYLPPIPPMPPVPFLEASACPFQKWTMPEHRCYWKVVSPDTKVAVAFGLVAARRYGTDMTLWQSMRGRGDPYRTLLREGTTALLNSYNSLQFPYHPFHVVQHMNLALMGSTRQSKQYTSLNLVMAMNTSSTSLFNSQLVTLLLLLGFFHNAFISGHKFTIEEATIKDIQGAFREKKLTSRQLVDFYIRQIETLNPALRSVIEVSPDAQDQADQADGERKVKKGCGLGDMHGIPVLLKDSIATRDKLNTTCGSYALLGSVVARDAGVVERLRRGGAIIMGKASLSEWYQFRSLTAPNGWSPRGGHGVNPYVQGGDPCGSSSGSAISVAANMVAVSLGTETDGSIICPADYNSVVGLKPTVGLTSRAGAIPITPRQDTIGPITRTVTDAVYVLDAIVGVDLRDHEATVAASKFIPPAGYKHFLNKAGLKGKRLGVVMNPFLALLNRSADAPIFKDHLKTLRQGGATVLENLEIASIDVIMDPFQSGEEVATLAEFKLALNAYLKELLTSPVRSLADIISFNLNNPGLERTEEFGQDIFEAAESTNGIGEQEKEAVKMMEKLSQDGFEKLMKENKLDALVTPGSSVSTVLAIGGYPAISVPAGYDSTGMPYGICFGGRKSQPFPIEEATIKDLQSAFADNKLTSRQLVDFYIRRIKTLNPVLRAVIEVNPDAQELADKADRERNSNGERGWLGELHGIPVLVKDTIGTRDKLNTTAGSYALLGSEVGRDAGVVERLREAGAVILGKTSMRSPCGSSSGSAISVAANMVAVSLGTETHSSIICPADHNSVVGLKPTVGLTTRAGVIPMTPRWDTIGPICRTVADAVYVLDVIAGIDPRDGATSEAARYIPEGGYKQFLHEDGLNGKRLGIVRSPFLDKLNGSPEVAAFEHHINTLRQRGANVVDDLKITHVDTILDPNRSGELEIMLAEFKASINAYMKDLITSPVRSLADIIAFNRQNYEMEKLREHDQETFTASEETDGFGKKEIEALETLEKLSQLGFERLKKENELDAMVTPGSRATAILAIGGYPGITVPAGYDTDGRPFGICFGGLKWSEPKLIEIAFAFEQATMARVPPSTVSLEMVTVPLEMDNKMSFHSSLFLVLLALSSICVSNSIKEATLQDLHYAFQQNRLTSMQLVEFYLEEIRRLNPILRGVIEVNPDGLYQADKADRERKARAPGSLSGLHGIPVLVKDLIATKDKLNTTAGSFALLGSVVPRDAGMVAKLRKAGAIILGKASLSEWANFRSLVAPNARGSLEDAGYPVYRLLLSAKQGNPYVLSADPCGSSSGSAISVAANMVSVSLGTETDGSILCPSSSNAVVGIKPTVGLTSRAGVIPISPRQDTVGPICRTVSDAVYVLDAIVGFDHNDAEATREASKYLPHGGYTQFLKIDGLMGKRLGIVRNPFFKFPNGSALPQAFEHHFKTLRERGAVLVDHLEIADLDVVLNFTSSGEATAMLAEFKLSLNSYLKELVVSPIRTLADAIAFNQKFSDLEMIKEFGQNIFLAAEVTNGIGDPEKKALLNLAKLNRDGFERLMWDNKLDALVTPGADASALLAMGGFPGISVPAAYDGKGVPVGICFGGLKGSEPKLIEIAYGFEQASKIRMLPTFQP
ncbi:hypothetical protein RJ639_037853 [Escallonia herrerae]|uniref:Amidase domain-containing protein n=1 Tax=Escallonia herrerae TaxID=1293975 RepID=A0AA88WPI5_9ASTE|nr:hypothetical protein RJ639_037853 [Escallonia herrerae]